ncbi:glycogen synthase [Gemmiger gallinarum]
MAQKKAQSAKKQTAEVKAAPPAAKKAEPAVKKAEPAAKKAEPAAEKAAPAAKKAEPAAKKAEPAVKKAEPAAKKAEPAAKKAEPAAKKAEPAAKKAEPAAKKAEPAAEKAAPAAKKAEPAAKKAEPAAKKAEPAAKKAEPAAEKAEPAAKKAEPAAKKAEPAAEKAEPAAKKAAPAAKKAKPAAKKTKPAVKKAAPAPAPEEAKPVAQEPVPAAEESKPAVQEPVEPEKEVPMEPQYVSPRRSVAFIGSECHPFVKTGGLGDVMYALPRELVAQNCDVRVILPRYACIPQKYQDKMVYRGEFYMDLGKTGRNYYVGIMEYVCDGVVYDFIDNQEFFSAGNPYIGLVDDIPKYCYFSKAALAALNYLNWIPDIIHCHDWQAALVPVYLRTMFQDSPIGRAKTVLTIHNLRFQGIYNIPTLQYWTGLPDEVFNMGAMKQGYEDANMLKAGLAYADRITTVSNTYAQEIQTAEYGEKLEDHLRYHSYKLRGIVNGIDYGMWNPATDPALAVNYDITNVLDHKWENKLALQQELDLVQDQGKFVIGLISRLTNQKGLDLVNAIIPQVMDGNTQVVVLGTGDKEYEDTFRYYENAYKGMFSACIQYDESRAHRIYAGADALLVPSRFEPCGLTQLNAMHYGTLPIVRETGGLKDTVQPYNIFNGDGNGFTFDRYDAGLLLDAINRAKTEYFINRYHWDEVVQRDMAKDVSWENSARQYKDLYLELTPW